MNKIKIKSKTNFNLNSIKYSPFNKNDFLCCGAKKYGFAG